MLSVMYLEWDIEWESSMAVAIFTVLLILTVIAAVPLAVFLGYCGYIVWGILFLIMIYYALRVEKFKKENDIMTYKEIVAFTEGKQLDEIEKAQEKGKRPYRVCETFSVNSL